MDYGKVSWNALNLNIVYNYRDNYGDAAVDKDFNDFLYSIIYSIINTI